MEFFGPLTLVNGRIWPRATVHAGVYRLRILNGANARTFRLRFTDGDGTPIAVRLQLIGSDGGLLDRPLDLNDGARRPHPGSITLAVPFRAYAANDTAPEQGARLYMTGRYMYHGHILEHEDHEMMRPYVVMPPEVVDHTHHAGMAMHGTSGRPMA